MECIRTHPVADYFCDDRGAAPDRKLQFFEDQDTGAFADNKSVAVFIPRAAGTFRLVVSKRECPHRGKATHAHWCNRSLSAAANHGIRIASLDYFEGITDGVRTGGAGSSDSGV